jgi:hypothetical protein
MSAVRESALVLHGLNPNDRDWLLARLPNERAEELRSLVDELQSLGLPSDGELTSRATRRAPIALVPVASTAVQVISTATADQLHSLLAEEADSVLAIVASSSAWRWREKWLARLEPLRAQRVRKLMVEHSTTPALRQAVLEAVAQSLCDVPDASTRGNSALQRAHRWFSDRLWGVTWRK